MILAKLKGDDPDTFKSYWTLMDVDGMIHEMSEGLSDVLNSRDWSSI